MYLVGGFFKGVLQQWLLIYTTLKAKSGCERQLSWRSSEVYLIPVNTGLSLEPSLPAFLNHGCYPMYFGWFQRLWSSEDLWPELHLSQTQTNCYISEPLLVFGPINKNKSESWLVGVAVYHQLLLGPFSISLSPAQHGWKGNRCTGKHTNTIYSLRFQCWCSSSFLC